MSLETMRLQVVVQTGRRCTEVLGMFDGLPKIALAAPAVDGEANAALCRFIAQSFGVPLRSVKLSHGLRSRRKTLLIEQPQQIPDWVRG